MRLILPIVTFANLRREMDASSYSKHATVDWVLVRPESLDTKSKSLSCGLSSLADRARLQLDAHESAPPYKLVSLKVATDFFRGFQVVLALGFTCLLLSCFATPVFAAILRYRSPD